MRKLCMLAFVACFSVAGCQSTPRTRTDNILYGDSVRVVKSGLTYPWEILWGKDGFIWVTERGGKISKIDSRSGATLCSLAVPDVVSRNEGGMLGMVQHPDFTSNGLFYVVYNYRSGGEYLEKLVQFRYENNAIKVVRSLIEGIPATTNHNGSRLLVSSGADPKLFMTTGDALTQANAQSLSSLSGKVLRFNLDGTIPADNPFPNSPVWSYGHRNQQGLVQVNGILYASEHGPTIEDEINIIEKGRNYGWPVVNGPCDQPTERVFCETNSIREPIWSSGSSTIAVCGLDYYNHSRIPQWKNCLLMVMLKDASLKALKLSSNGRSVLSEQTYFKPRFGRLRDICVSPDGRVYICTSNGSGGDMLLEVVKL